MSHGRGSDSGVTASSEQSDGAHVTRTRAPGKKEKARTPLWPRVNILPYGEYVICVSLVAPYAFEECVTRDESPKNATSPERGVRHAKTNERITQAMSH